MNTTLRPFLLLALLLSTSVVLAQTRFGAKVGVNYLIGSQKIQPEPKDPPTNPKGLGMMFGGYMELDLSDQFGIRPELGFSFRRMKTEFTSKESYSADDNATLN
ncbi:MAG: outer membrane beta-barrel protein, partial [Flavobacteriales bacterium]|nr:outer membrane beta-barrel protein [Flavobacteriales bacterium]